MPKQRVQAIYSGNVQGVGFRATTAMLVNDFQVVGSVRNRSDGTVEVIAEGDTTELDAFLERIAEQLRHHIESVDSRRSEATGQFDDFRITF